VYFVVVGNMEDSHLVSLAQAPTTVRVSSILERNRKLYGGENMLSDDIMTCWNSAQGSPQQILLSFQRLVNLERLEMMFQGGFVGQNVLIQVRFQNQKEFQLVEEIKEFDPEDSNALQIFPCKVQKIEAMKIIFQRSTDFYGRVILYRLNLLGHEENTIEEVNTV
jgi:hypothetical protein